jgi:Flp pilus assembly protein TadD
VDWFERAEKLDPSNVASLVHRIEAYARMGQHDQAEVMFYLAQQVDPAAPQAFVNLADSLMDRGLFERAVWCLREAARLDPELPRVQARLAEAYAAAGRQERARQLYLRELRSNPGDVGTLLDLGCLLIDMDRLPEAAEKFRRVLEIEPDNPDAHFYLGDAAERERRDADALVHFDVAVRLDPEYPGARRRLASLLLRRGQEGDGARAHALFRREVSDLSRDPDRFDPHQLEGLARALLDAGLPGEAATVLQRLVEQRPEDAQARHLHSVALFQAGHRHAGMAEARRVLRLDPRHVAAMHNLALACLQDGRWRHARFWARRARRIDPEDAFLRRLRLTLGLHALVETAASIARFWVRRR